MRNRIQTFLIKFVNEIDFEQIPKLRSGVLKAMSHNADVLFHNHKNTTSLRYAYPLIQYKRIGGKAAILCVGEGVNAIGEFLSLPSLNVQINTETVTLNIERAIPKVTTAQVWDDAFSYTTRKWLPFNSDNYTRYCNLPTDEEKQLFIERLLVANILSFFKGAGITVEKEIACKITSLTNARLLKFKNTKLMAFDVCFDSNVTLPNYIGIGRHTSVGFGTTVACKGDTHAPAENCDKAERS